MMSTAIYSEHIVTPDGIQRGYLLFDETGFQSIEENKPDLDIIDHRDDFLYPGIIDLHTHGYFGISFINELERLDQKKLKDVVSRYPSIGVTSLLCACDVSAMEEIRKAMKAGYPGTQILGLNMEGIFTTRMGENSARGEDTRAIDMDFVRSVLRSGGEDLKIASLAPETVGSEEAIHMLRDAGVVVSACHTNANYEEMCQAYQHGITHMTHLGNVMRGIHHRDVGALGAGLLHEDIYCEIIADMHHLCKEMIDLMFHVKSYDRFALISDSICIGGLEEGNYYLDDTYEVHITSDHVIRDAGGRFCGGWDGVLHGMKNLHTLLHIDPCALAQMASLTPASILHMDDTKGSITPEKDADFIIVDHEWNLLKTYIGGKLAYQKNNS